MTTVYLGGPMRGYPIFNFESFDHGAKLLRNSGYTVLSPAEHDRECGFDEHAHEDTNRSPEGFDLEAAFKWDLAAIERADCVVFLAGWKHSEGCDIEHRHARANRKPVYEMAFVGQTSFTLALIR